MDESGLDRPGYQINATKLESVQPVLKKIVKALIDSQLKDFFGKIDSNFYSYVIKRR